MASFTTIMPTTGFCVRTPSQGGLKDQNGNTIPSGQYGYKVFPDAASAQADANAFPGSNSVVLFNGQPWNGSTAQNYGQSSYTPPPPRAAGSIPAEVVKSGPLGTGDICGIYTSPTSGGFLLAVDTHHNRNGDTLNSTKLRICINGTGSWKDIKVLSNGGSSGGSGSGPYGLRQTFQVSYAELNQALVNAGIQNITLGPGCPSAQLGVYVAFAGHDQGVGGGGGSFGNHGFACP